MVVATLLSAVSLCLACTQTSARKSMADAAGVRPDGEAGLGSDASVDRALSPPDQAIPALDTAAGNAEAATDLPGERADLAEIDGTQPDGITPDSPDSAEGETGKPGTDSGGILDGPCRDNPSDLMQVLATSIGSSFCSRTASTQPYGFIGFDGEGQVTFINGNHVPVDKDAWVASLATYRWPCLANQTIAYGCSL